MSTSAAPCHPVQLGLTGGIGSGKSTVAGLLVERGATLIDADAISRSLTAAGGAAMPAIAAQFGPSFVDADGALNRAAMRERVFTDSSARHALEAIVHPLIQATTAARVHAAQAAGTPLIVHDVPLLVESGPRWRARCQAVWVVDCAPETQIQRVMQRNQLGEADVRAILSAQAPRLTRLRAADLVIVNDGIDLQQLADLVKQAAARFGL